MSVQDYLSLQTAQTTLVKSHKEENSKPAKPSSRPKPAQQATSKGTEERWKLECADLTQRDGGYGDRPVVTLTASIHQARQEIDRFAEYVMILRRKIDKHRETLSTKIEIQSDIVRKAIQIVFGDYPYINLKANPIVFRKPYVHLFHYREELYAYARDRKRSRVEKEHLKVLTSFMRIHLRDTVREYKRLVPNGLISYNYLNTLFKPGEVVVSLNDEVKECYLVLEADERENKDSEKYMQVKCYSWKYNGARFGPFLNRLSIDSFSGVRRINQLNVFPISQLPTEEQRDLKENLRVRGLKWRSLVDLSHNEYDGIARVIQKRFDGSMEHVPAYIKGRVILDYKTFLQSNPSFAVKLENTGSIIDVENEIALEDVAIDQDISDDDTETTDSSDDSLANFSEDDYDEDDDDDGDDEEYEITDNADDDDDDDDDDDGDGEIDTKEAVEHETKGTEEAEDVVFDEGLHKKEANLANETLNDGVEVVRPAAKVDPLPESTVTAIETNGGGICVPIPLKAPNGRVRHDAKLTTEKHQEERNILKSYLSRPAYIPSKLQALLCPGRIPGFSLVEKKWGDFAVDRIEPINWTKDVFEKLEIDMSSKNVIRSLVQMHQSDSSAFDDIIAGKGKGLIFLLFGPPGCGKTLTAETIAEYTRKPLYWVTSGELGTDIATTDSRLRTIFGLAKAWDAILLLDEADVFLAKRTRADMVRNAFVSIFLRSIEYYQGILFLTTNRREEFDEAFQSRIHLSLEYPALDNEKRARIWRNLLEARPVPAAWDMRQYHHFGAKFDLNGREIKNLISTTLAIAKHDGRTLDEETIDMVYALNQKARLFVSGVPSGLSEP